MNVFQHVRLIALLILLSFFNGISLSKSVQAAVHPGYCFDVGLSKNGDVLFLPSGYGTHLLQVNKSSFTYLNTLRAYDDYHRNIKISNHYAYIAEILSGLEILDISDPFHPQTIFNQTLPGISGDGMGLFVRESIVFLVSGNAGLKIIDVSQPATPTLVGSVKTMNSAWDVWVVGNYAYIADLEAGMTVVDISNPESPHLITTITWAVGNNMAEIIRGHGQRLYVAAGVHGMVTIDISDPVTPQVRSIFKSDPSSYGEGLDVDGTIVYLANGNANVPAENGLYILDLSNPDTPQILGKLSFSGWVEGVLKLNQTVYVANTRDGVRAIDVTTLNQPKEIAHWYGLEPESETTPTPTRTPSPNDWFIEITESAGFHSSGNALSFAFEDHDRDGDLDIYVFGGGSNRDALYQNQGKLHFSDVGESSGLPSLRSTVAGAWADANNDGSPDLILGYASELGLYTNNGFGQYSKAATIGFTSVRGWSTWMDYNGDNGLDLLTYDEERRIALYEYRKPQFYENVAETAGINYRSSGDYVLCSLDIESDGYADFFSGGGYTFVERPELRATLWFNNQDGTFLNIGMSSGISEFNHEAAMPAVGDFDRNGLFDLYLPKWQQASLFALNQGNHQFKLFGLTGALQPAQYAYGIATGDIDSDGYLDLLLTKTTNGYLVRSGEGLNFTDITDQAGFIMPGGMRCPAWADLDGDFDLDLVVIDAAKNIRLFENRAPQGNTLIVLPLTDRDGDATDQKTQDDRTAIGAIVSVDADGDGDFQSGPNEILLVRDISAGSAGRSQPWAHFGLGNVESADIRVLFPDGSTVEIQKPLLNQILIVRDRKDATSVTHYIKHE